jgi:hypothetical protein
MFVVLQRQFNNPNANPQGPDAGTKAGGRCFYGVLLAVGLTIQILFLLSLSKCFKEIDPRNRQMEPGQVWLNLIPLFNIVWIILTVLKLADSLRAEYRDRGIHGDDDYGKTIGLVYVISALIGCSPVALVCFIMYWVKVAGYTRQLREAGGRGDYDDDRPSRRRDRDDEDDRRDRDEDDRPSRRRNRDDD